MPSGLELTLSGHSAESIVKCGNTQTQIDFHLDFKAGNGWII